MSVLLMVRSTVTKDWKQRLNFGVTPHKTIESTDQKRRTATSTKTLELPAKQLPTGIYYEPRCGDGAESNTSKSPGKGQSKKQRAKKAAKTKGETKASTGKRERAASKAVARNLITKTVKPRKPREQPKGSKNRSKK